MDRIGLKGLTQKNGISFDGHLGQNGGLGLKGPFPCCMCTTLHSFILDIPALETAKISFTGLIPGQRGLFINMINQIEFIFSGDKNAN